MKILGVAVTALFSANLLFSAQAFAIPATELKNKIISDGVQEKESNVTFTISDKGMFSHNGVPEIAFVFDGKNAALLNYKRKMIANEADVTKLMGQKAALVAAFLPDFKVAQMKAVGAVNSWKCQKFSVSNKGQTAGQLCAAKMKDLGMNPREIKIFKMALNSFASVQAAMGIKTFSLVTDVAQKYDSMPVDASYKFVLELFGQTKEVASKFKTLSANRVDASADKFKIPSGFRHPNDLKEMMELLKEQ